MAGTFLLGERKVRPGAYYRRERAGISVEGATNGILAVIFQSNWGVLNKEFDVDQTMLNNLDEYFGDGATVLREGLLGGATVIRAVRVGGDDGEVAKVMLKTAATTAQESTTLTVEVGEEDVTRELDESAQDVQVLGSDGALIVNEDYTVTGSTLTIRGVEDGRGEVTVVYTKTVEVPEADGVEVSARYPGDRSFTASVRTNLITDKRQLLIYDGVNIFVSVSFDAGDDEAQALVDALKNNRHFTGRKLNSGVLNDVVQAQLTGGVNPTVTTANYDRGTEILERYRWNAVVSDTDESAVAGILSAFVSQGYETGRLGMAVVAGQSSQDLETRMSYAASCNDEKVVYVLNGWVSNDGTVYDGWRAAARIGGMIAASETNASLTHEVISNALELIEPLTNGEITRAEQKGCLVLSLNADDQVQIDSAINTLITLGTDLDAGWSKIRRTKCRFELMDRINRTHDKLVGKVNNDSNGRATIIAAANKVINEMIAENKLVYGSYCEEDPGHPAEGDSAWFRLNILDYDSAEKIYNSFVFRFNQSFDEE